MPAPEAGPLPVTKRGAALLADPALNKGTAFSVEERDAFGLHGLLPVHVETIEARADRVRAQLDAEPDPLRKHQLLRAVQDDDETLFLRVLLDDITTLLPIVYTPTVGEACQNFSRIYQHPRGVFLSYPEVDRIREILRSVPNDRAIEVIVVTDGERILGLGDQGADGLGIPIGKLSLYSACGGIDPDATLPIVLDVGTNNEERRNDPEYLGWRHERIVGPDYDAFVEEVVAAVIDVFPDVLFQFEDFAEHHAHLLLDRYRDRLCTFNDDIQGTATVALAAALSALRRTDRRISEQRVVIVGAGSAGSGIAEQIVAGMVDEGISDADARRQMFMVDRPGLLLADMDGLEPFQVPLAQAPDAVAGWDLAEPGVPSLADVIRNARPSILIGVTGVFGLFTEEVVRAMAEADEAPVIFPLSNPTSRAEATAEDVLRWTEGRALVATGSPFAPVTIDGTTHVIAQSNNAYIFPGVGLGVRAVGARRVSDAMFMAAARALAEASAPAGESAPAVSSTPTSPGAAGGGGGGGAMVDAILPPLTSIREVSRRSRSPSAARPWPTGWPRPHRPPRWRPWSTPRPGTPPTPPSSPPDLPTPLAHLPPLARSPPRPPTPPAHARPEKFDEMWLLQDHIPSNIPTHPSHYGNFDEMWRHGDPISSKLLSSRRAPRSPTGSRPTPPPHGPRAPSSPPTPPPPPAPDTPAPPANRRHPWHPSPTSSPTARWATRRTRPSSASTCPRSTSAAPRAASTSWSATWPPCSCRCSTATPSGTWRSSPCSARTGWSTAGSPTRTRCSCCRPTRPTRG
ncbi:MAG: NAD-dependent malic enzyme [Acidimicrobiales bacterium]